MRILEYIFKIDTFTLFSIIFVPLYVIVMVFAFNTITSLNKGIIIWRGLCFSPCILILFHLYFCGFKGEPLWTLHYYKTLYIGFLGSLLLLFFPEKQTLHKFFSSLAIISVFIGSVSCLVNINLINVESKISNYSKNDYVTAFKKTVEQMKKNYPLSEWKEIDYDAIEAEITPKIKAAQDNNDPAAFYSAMNEYVYLFHDGHVSISAMTISGAAKIQEALSDSYGHDFGFSMITLSNGKTIAIMNDFNSVAYHEGICEGTVITKWNGENIDKAIDNVVCPLFTVKFPVAENEDIIKPMFLAGQGGEHITVSFVDESGKEKEIKLSSTESYKYRFQQTLDRFFHDAPEWYCLGDNAPDVLNEEMKKAVSNYEENFSTKMISDDCGYILINSLTYHSSNLNDTINAMLFCKYPTLIDEIDRKLSDMKEQGMDKLVIDLRNNQGGSASLASQITALFTDEKVLALSHGKYKNNNYYSYGKIYVEPNGKWKDLKIAVLVNAKCVSAGDLLCKLLSECDNVVLIGTTCSNNSCQSIGGVCVLPGSEACIKYPMFIELDENNVPLIDTDASRESRIPLDIVIPITAESSVKVFSDHLSDHELEYAVNYLSKLASK